MIEAGVLDGCESESDTDRLGRLFDVHHDRLYRLARRLSQNREEAQDLVQDTFLRAGRSRDGVPKGASAEEAWLVRVLVNLCRDRWRRMKVRVRANTRCPTPAAGANPEGTYIDRLAVQAALARLAPRRRAIVVLHEIDGLEVPSIGRLLGVSAVTVRWHLSRARTELGRALGTDPRSGS